jgi:hypothetical protein
MDMSILKTKYFYPFNHEYSIMPLEHKEALSFPVNIHADDKWLYESCPTLVLKTVNQNKDVYSIEPNSAIRFIANSGFSKTGILTQLSPELTRANGMCFSVLKWPKERLVPKYCSAQRIYKTKMDIGPKKAVKSSLSKKRLQYLIGPPKAMWECRGRYHEPGMPITIPAKHKEFLKLPICISCFNRHFVSAPTSWTPLSIYSTYFKQDFIDEMITPLQTKPLLPVLTGAVFAATLPIQFEKRKSITEQLSTIYNIVIRFPEAFLMCGHHKSNTRLLRLWSLVLGYEKHHILGKLVQNITNLDYIAMLKTISPMLCTHSYANSTKEIRMFNSKVMATNLKRGSTTRIAKTATLLVVDVPWTPFVHYNEYNNILWIFSTDVIASLYTLALSKIKIKFKLVASYLEPDHSTLPMHCIHPNNILHTNFTKPTDVTIYPSELLGWHQIRYLLDQKNINTLSLYGNYATSRYGIQSMYSQFTHGACFADFMDICHINLAKDTNKQFCTLGNVEKEPLDLSHASSMLCTTNSAIETIECQYWKPGKITQASTQWATEMAPIMQLLHTKEHPLHHYLKPHVKLNHPGLGTCIPPTLKRTLLHLRLLVL